MLDDYANNINLAWNGKLPFASLLEYATLLEQRGLRSLAIVLYQTWLQRNKTTFDPFANFNLGACLFNENELQGALDAYTRAIRLAPEFVHPRFNCGLVHERLGQLDAAEEHWQWVVDNASPDKPDQKTILISALNNLGRLLESRKQFANALSYLDKSLLLDAHQPDVIHHWVFLREKQCLWPVYTPIGEVSVEQMRAATSALAMISLSDDPEAQLAVARNYAERKIPGDLPVLAPDGGYRHDRIRIGYCSSDFCQHPVAMLTVQLFELHDRSRFEVFAFCWSPEDGSQLRARIIDASDHFIRINALDDTAAAHLIREHEIDILIDLQGQTRGARTTMLAHRPAPIQITYLGLPATTGFPFIDYVIADHYLIPEDYACYYSEKPLYMPDVYQVSDQKRLCAPPPTRKSCGLPSDAFVFCSFNNNHKYTADVFNAWMNILRRVPDSVLWLLADNPWAEHNLRSEAKARGIEENRIVFATRVSTEQYLSRYALADLFLDTYPFNAGTTANDALWMSLPVLTISGKCFASRMAGALLTAAGLDELITRNLKDYEDTAVALAMDPVRCKNLRETLGDVRENGVLFDTPRFVRNFEQVMTTLFSYSGGQSPRPSSLTR